MEINVSVSLPAENEFEDTLKAIFVNPGLTDEQRGKLFKVLRSHRPIFPTKEMPHGDVKDIALISMTINLSNKHRVGTTGQVEN